MDFQLQPLISVFLVGIFLLTGCATLNREDSNQPHVRQLFTEGLAYEGLSEFTSALDRYHNVIETTSNSPWVRRAHLRTARIYRNHLNDPKKSIHHYGSFLGEADGDTLVVEARLELARLYRNEKRYQDAAEQYRTIYDSAHSGDNREEAYYYLGEIYRELEQYERSIDVYEKFLREFPGGDLADGALLNLARNYNDLGRYQDQMESYRRLLKEYPESGLREYIYYEGVRSAVARENQSQAREWARGYREEFDQGQYWSEIKTQLKNTFTIEADTLNPDPLLEK